MARSSTTWKPGEGRPKGIITRRVKEREAYAQSYLKDGDHQDAMRLVLSNPNHEHFRWAVELTMAYAYGKPTEHVHQTSDGTLPSHQFQVAFLDYDKFFQLEEAEKEVGHGMDRARDDC